MTRGSQYCPTSHRVTASRLTPVGRGAVATIQVCCDRVFDDIVRPEALERAQSGHLNPLCDLNSLFHAANGIELSEQPLKKIAFGEWGQTDREELVVCRITSNVLEIHCHGGEAAIQRILTDLSNAGCTVVDWREQSSHCGDILDVECADVLSQTSTWRTTSVVLEQSNGVLRTEFLSLLWMSSNDDRHLEARLDELLNWAKFGEHLSKPWSVVISGRPNVGKSSLINALLGYQRAIVFDQPGTTRDVVTGDTAFDGWPVVLADTAGIRESSDELETAGIALARKRLQSADLRLVVIDVSQPPSVDDEDLLSEWPDALVVANKSDLENRWSNRLPQKAILVSSVTGNGLLELQQELIRRLLPRIPKFGTPIPITVRQVARLREARNSSTAESRHTALEGLLGENR